jgi:hypothetical protein
MPTLVEIPFDLDPAALRDKTHVATESDVVAEFNALVEHVRTVARPKALYRECFVEARGSDTITIGGVKFESLVLRRNLEGVERVFPYVATCGREADGVLTDSGDFVKSFWLDGIKTALLSAAREHLTEHLARHYALGEAATMNPGSGDSTMWPIEQQRQLFALLGDVKGETGVELTESFLMIPNKTVSGIRFPTEVDFRSCQLCHRADCPSRAAPFDQALWASMQHE